MSDRKWEDLPVDCLVDIFGRVGVMSLVYEVPYVCKSWYVATLNPSCWQSLIIPYNFVDAATDSESLSGFLRDRCNEKWYIPSPRKYPIGYCFKAFVKFVIHRSRGSATELSLPFLSLTIQELLDCIGDGCPSLKRLALPNVDMFCDDQISSRICKWKYLEAFEIAENNSLVELITQISIHCKKFASLTASAVSINESVASAIATLLPNIEFLFLKGSGIERSNLVTILKGCKKLVHFDAGFLHYDVDDEIRNLSAHIATFKFECSLHDYDRGYYHPSEYDYECYSSDDLDDYNPYYYGAFD